MSWSFLMFNEYDKEMLKTVGIKMLKPKISVPSIYIETNLQSIRILKITGKSTLVDFEKFFISFTTENIDKFTNLKFLDISYNGLSLKSAKYILMWAKLKSIEYINIRGNHDIHLSEIRNLYNAFLTVDPHIKNNISELMNKFIFVPKDIIMYLSRLDNFKKLVKDKIILPEWIIVHKGFYQSVLFDNLKNKEKYISELEFIQDIIKLGKDMEQ